MGAPKYIVVEGVDGCGKGAVLGAVQKQFPLMQPTEVSVDGRIETHTFTYRREPGGTSAGEAIRDLVLSTPMSPFSEMLLLTAQRKEARDAVAGFHQNGVHVVSDRSDPSTYAYQMHGRRQGHMENLFWQLDSYLAPFPTCYIILDVDPHIAAKRRVVRGNSGAADVFEREAAEFFARVREGYLAYKRALKRDVPVHIVNAEQPPENVADEVLALIIKHITTEQVRD